MNQPRVRLLVLRAADVDRTADFYRCLGVEFTAERHGNGPRHFAAELGELVLKIYPAARPGETDRSTRLGFATADPRDTMDRLRAWNAEIVQELQLSPWGPRAIVHDPDGRTVEISGDAASG